MAAPNTRQVKVQWFLEFRGFGFLLMTSIGVAFKFRAPPRPPGAPGASKHDTGKDYTELLSLTPPEFPVPYVNGIKIETAFDMLCERESPQTHPPLHRWTNLTPNQRCSQYCHTLSSYNC